MERKGQQCSSRRVSRDAASVRRNPAPSRRVPNSSTSKQPAKANAKAATTRKAAPKTRQRQMDASKEAKRAAAAKAAPPAPTRTQPRSAVTVRSRNGARQESAASTGQLEVYRERPQRSTSSRRTVQLPSQTTGRMMPVSAPAQTQKTRERSEAQATKERTQRSDAGSSPRKSNSKGPQARTESNGHAFVGFYRRNLRFALPITILLVVIIGAGVLDLGLSFGKIHPGVTVEGVSVGGMTTQEAASVLEDELSNTLADAHLQLYASEDVATEDGVSLASDESASNANQAYADEASSKKSKAASDVDGDGDNDKWSINAESVGAYIDGGQLADKAYLVGREGNFIGDRIMAWLGKVDVSGSVVCNQDLFSALVTEINKAQGTKIKEARIKVTSSGKAKVKKGHEGWLVDETSLVDAISAGVFNSSRSNFLIPFATQAQHLTPDNAQSVADQVNSALSQVLTLVYGDETWSLDAAALGSLIGQRVLEPDEVLVIENGKQEVQTSTDDNKVVAAYDTSAGYNADTKWTLQAFVDQTKADEYLVSILGKKATGGAKNARFDTSSGDKVKIIKSKNGTGPDRAAAELQLQNILFGSDTSSTITLVDTVIEPERTTEDAKAMGIKEKLATWSIPLSGTSARINNIRLLCDTIDGSLIEPGGTWSFNETTGERTADKGYEEAAVIVNGKHEDQLGGGVCQVATCVFNAVCYSGLGIVTRTNHDFYISAYDDYGFADATVSWEEPDFAWENDTDNWILLTADASGSDVIVTLWGTDDGREVTCERGEWKEGATYKTIRENDDTLAKGTEKVEQEGQDGRSITIHYLVTSAEGDTLHDIKFTSVYQAQNKIILVGTKVTTTTESDTTSDGDEETGDTSDTE